MLQFQVVVQFQFLLWEQSGFPLLLDKGPDSLAGLSRSLKICPVSRGNVPDQKINEFITSIHNCKSSSAGSRGQAVAPNASTYGFIRDCL